jgi:HK97 family phage major capsid protein
VEILQLEERKLELATQMRACFPENGSMSTAQKRRYDELAEELHDVQSNIISLKRSEARLVGRPPENLIGEPVRPERAGEKRYRTAFRNYLRSGFNGVQFGLPRLSEEDRDTLRFEKRDMEVGSPTASIPTSVFVPQGFVYDVDVAMKYYGPMTTVAKILPTATGQPLPYPTANDTANAASIIGEAQQVSELDVTIGNIVFGAWKYTSGLVKVSLELLQDSAFDIDAFLKEQFAIRFGRGLNTAFTNGLGSGSSQPMGFMTAATAGPTAIGSSTNTGGSEDGSTSIGTKDITNLIQSVDPWYRPGSAFLMHDETRAFLEGLLDKYGRPLFVPNPQSGRLESLYGYPVYINNDMATIAANAKTVAFGQFQKYLIRKVKDMSVIRLVERFADYGEVGFIGFARYDGNLIDAGTHPIKYLVQAAS